MTLQNYDFEKNKKKIIKLLSSERYKVYYKNMLEEYLEVYPEFQDCDQFKRPEPYSWGVGDAFFQHLDKIEEQVKKEYKRPKTKEERKQIRKEIRVRSKKELFYWVPNGLCHWFNKHISLPLAQELFPGEEWDIRTNDHTHTTVVNCRLYTSTYSKFDYNIFDPLYFIAFPKSTTYGGMEAYIDSDPCRPDPE
jgi:hypothetical protein